MKFLEAKQRTGDLPNKMSTERLSDKMRRVPVANKDANTVPPQVPAKDLDEIKFASAEAETLASQYDVDLDTVIGSGKDGGITTADVRQAMEKQGIDR